MLKTITIILFLTAAAYSQATECPPAMVCLPTATAKQLLADADEAKLLKVEIKTLSQAIADYKNLISKTEIELAKASGEKTQLEATLARYNAIIDLLLKNAKPKKIGLINL